ncbi:hypothetical protein [Methylibium sp. Root1272]|uniref:hypothetical protein n=1 Tax=Methylibium sp. Root1272 TaxID=1736441 RepID=UPI0012E74D36|nr:hypothetical protein [Methylibium sp. Root1272]
MRDETPIRPVWDPTLAEALPGAVLLVGITYLAADGSLIEQQQFFGRVQSAHPAQGIALILEGRRRGERYNLPPDTRSLARAELGEYRLRSTGEVVVNPDFTVSFSLQRQAH